MKFVLTIAGSDSGGGAGIQADLKTFAALGVHGGSAITAITAQSSTGIRDVVLLEPRLVVSQIEALADDLQISATKTGMLASAPIVEAVAEVAGRRRLSPLVVDPVMASSTGDALLEPRGREAYLMALFPLTTVLTPNLAEAGAFLGTTIATVGAMKDAAKALHALGPRVVVVKGGHLEGDPIDVFFDGSETHEIPGPRVATPNTHGTGCTFSSALAARLALGDDPLQAVVRAKLYMKEALLRGYPLGRGRGVLGHIRGEEPR